MRACVARDESNGRQHRVAKPVRISFDMDAPERSFEARSAHELRGGVRAVEPRVGPWRIFACPSRIWLFHPESQLPGGRAAARTRVLTVGYGGRSAPPQRHFPCCVLVRAGPASTLRVRVTTMKKRSRPIHYLLSADQRLRRLSLRRLAKHGKPTRNPRRTTRPQKGRRPKAPVPSSATSTWPIVLSVIGIIAAGGFLAARQPSRRLDTAIAEP